MNRSSLGPALALALAAAAFPAQSAPAAQIEVTGAWTRPTVVGATNAVGYLTITNSGPQADRLVGGVTPLAKKIEIHRTTTAGGIMRMREIDGGVEIPPHTSVAFAPDGYHLMLVAPTRRFQPGDRIPAVLRFAHAGAVRTTFDVRTGAPMVMKMR